VRLLGYDVHRQPLPEPYGELKRLFGLLAVDHVIDVGANDGQYATALRELVGFAGRIDCVEPQPACAATLRRRLDVTVHETALGEEPGVLELTIYRDTSLTSLHTLNATGRGVWDDPTTADVTAIVPVQVQRLDDLLDTIALGQRVWLKVDTQGHDLAVFAGLRRHLDQIVGAQSEVAVTPLYDGAPEAWDHLRALAHLGFRLAGLTPIGRIDGAAFTEADGLFVRR